MAGVIYFSRVLIGDLQLHPARFYLPKFSESLHFTTIWGPSVQSMRGIFCSTHPIEYFPRHNKGTFCCPVVILRAEDHIEQRVLCYIILVLPHYCVVSPLWKHHQSATSPAAGVKVLALDIERSVGFSIPNYSELFHPSTPRQKEGSTRLASKVVPPTHPSLKFSSTTYPIP